LFATIVNKKFWVEQETFCPEIDLMNSKTEELVRTLLLFKTEEDLK